MMNFRPTLRAARPIRPAAPAAVNGPAVDRALAHGRLLHRALRTALLAACDSAMLALAGVLAYAAWALPWHGQPAAMYLELAPLLLLFVAGYGRAGLYPGLGLGPVDMLRRLSHVTTFGFIVLAAFSFAFKLPPTYSRLTFLIAFVLSLVLVPLGRRVMVRTAYRWHWWAEPIVVIGTGVTAARAIRSITRASWLGYRPVAVLTLDAACDRPALEGIPVLGGLDCLPALSAAGIRVAFVEVEQVQARVTVDRLQQQFLHVVLLREFDDLPVERLQVRDLGNTIGLEYTNNLLRPRNQAAKRVLDLIAGSAALLLCAPLILAAMLAVLLIDGRPVLFHQLRAGIGGRRIRVPKIRTMRRNADQELEEYLTGDPTLRSEWATHYKLRQDPRLIPVIGRLFRRFSIDELPQLWTVIRGHMSLVGPRPFPDYHLARFTPAFRELRQRVRPGITGYWQIELRSEGTTEEQEALDTYYIRNWSVWFDLYLLARTIMAVAGGRGAY